MPVYEYASSDGKHRTVVRRVVEDRDLPLEVAGVELKRITVPDHVNVVGLLPVLDAGAGILAGYHRAECRQGSRFKSEFTAEQIKQAWKQP